MKRNITGIFVVTAVLVIAVGAFLIGMVTRGMEDTSVSAAGPTELKFSASLSFPAAQGNDVILTVTNNGSSNFTIADKAHYMDNIGSAGSWDCRGQKTMVEPGQTRAVVFRMENPAEHGDNSILAFYFQYQGQWYLGKTGVYNGTEYFKEHD